MPDRFICIHGHFYQPPRENPWLEDVEVEDSAAPYHDWNDRITAECYAPNAAARILDAQGRIASLANNYANISFNFGPTLLSWLEDHRPDVYEQILNADRSSVVAHNGHGNAIAQCYNHAIMPLASKRDKRIQVGWGIADFEYRFGRKPEGIWLPETAVDLETLQTLAEFGIKFTILAPSQAQSIREFGAEWQDVSGGRIDPTRAYRCQLGEGRYIDLFFYDQPVSHDISFEGLLKSGDRFADRLMSGFHHGREHSQLMHIATDGETFGHHSKFGEMALAYALTRIARDGLAKITNYGEYLELHPPVHEVMIRENTAWSCSHGVERWRSDCGCNSGSTQYHQRWRSPLRRSLNKLQAKLDDVYARHSALLLQQPHAAVEDYIEVILDRSPQSRESFLTKHAKEDISESETITAFQLLEMQRYANLIYTSCGWFFDDISNIETVKIIEFAARAIQLAREVASVDLESGFISDLFGAQGNKPHLSNGGLVYRQLVKPLVTSLEKVLAHYAISSLVEEYPAKQRIYSFEFNRSDYVCEKSITRTLAIGRVEVRSIITGASLDGMFVVLHLGGYDFHCAVREALPSHEYAALKTELFRLFHEDSTRNLLQAIDARIIAHAFALKDLFIEERRKLGRLFAIDALEKSREHYRRIYDESRDVMRLLASMKIPPPESLKRAVEYVLAQRVEVSCEALKRGDLSESDLVNLLASISREAESLGCEVDLSSMKEAFEQSVQSKVETYVDVRNIETIHAAVRVLRLADELGVDLDLWRLQNLCWELLKLQSAEADQSQAAIADLAHLLRFSEALVSGEATENVNVERATRLDIEADVLR